MKNVLDANALALAALGEKFTGCMVVFLDRYGATITTPKYKPEDFRLRLVHRRMRVTQRGEQPQELGSGQYEIFFNKGNCTTVRQVPLER